MKQLLDVSDGYAIVGLNERVFVGRLLDDDDKNAPREREGHHGRQHRIICELEPQPPSEGGGAATAVPAPSSPLEVQAVAIVIAKDTNNEQKKGRLYCAVSRYDKSLSVYDIGIDDILAAAGADVAPTSHTAAAQSKVDEKSNVVSAKAVLMMKPVAVHKTTKRAGSLCFASVPPPPPLSEKSAVGDDRDGSSSGTTADNSGPMPVVIAGDMSGEAVAFPLHPVVSSSSATPSTTSNAEKSAADDNSNKQENDDGGAVQEAESEHTNNKNNTAGRLLLGHTASMLTGVKVVRDDTTGGGAGVGTSRILTSDRDEKVRVSAFPNTFVVEGYLLGHEAFVSSIDVASTDSGLTLCATCGGDQTVRVWDYASREELLCVPVGSSPAESEVDVSVDSDGPVPSRIAMSPDGTKVVVAFDERRRLDLLSLINNSDGDDAKSLRASVVSFEGPSETLAVTMPDNQSILVLGTQPPYLQAYRLGAADCDQEAAESPSAPEPCNYPFIDALQSVLGDSSSSSSSKPIKMPTTVLEKEASGELKVKKLAERRSSEPAQLPWNNPKRKEVDRNRNIRRRKRRRERKEQE